MVLWSRFGPYHVARLNGLSSQAAAREDGVVGVEIAQRDAYAWEQGNSSGDFEQRTLFPDTRYEALKRWAIFARVNQLLNEIAPAVVAINGWSAPEAQAALSWRARKRRCRAILMSETKQDDAPRVWWREQAKRVLLRRYDAALVGGGKQVEYLTRLGFPHRKIFVGYDAVDNDYFGRRAEDARYISDECRSRLKLPRRYFICCARFLRRKNLDGVLRAYQRFKSAPLNRDWGLVVLGSGEHESELRRIEAELGLKDVLWPGFVQYDELPMYYGLASVFIHPAKEEAWGLVVNEAAASGLPLLVSRTVGAGYELVRNGENGFLFDPYSVDDMAAAMKRMADMSDQKRLKMGKRSWEIVADYSPRRFGEQLLAAADMALSPPDR